MKWIGYNIVAIFLILLSAYMIYNHTPKYGWVIFAACMCAVYPATKKDSE